MRVLHISGARSWGGNEQQLGDIIPNLKELGVENVVFGVANAPLHKYCLENDIEFIVCKSNKLNTLTNYVYLKKVVERYKPNIIHLHTSDSVTVFTLSDFFFSLRTPTVSSKKGMVNSMSILSKYKYNYKNINKILCVSKAVKIAMEKDVLTAKNKHKLTVVYEGINTNRILKVDDNNSHSIFKELKGKIVLGDIGNHVNAKDLHTLIHMMNYLVNDLNCTNVHLIQIGAFSPLTQSLKSLIEKLNMTNYVSLLGFQNNATQYLNQFDIFVMSSEREGLPLSIYEAFFKMIPVVSTKAGGIPEIITDGENGFLAEVKDYKTLANKIKMLIDSPELRTLFSQRAFAILNEKYTSDKAAEKIVKIYKDIYK